MNVAVEKKCLRCQQKMNQETESTQQERSRFSCRLALPFVWSDRKRMGAVKSRRRQIIVSLAGRSGKAGTIKWISRAKGGSTDTLGTLSL